MVIPTTRTCLHKLCLRCSLRQVRSRAKCNVAHVVPSQAELVSLFLAVSLFSCPHKKAVVRSPQEALPQKHARTKHPKKGAETRNPPTMIRDLRPIAMPEPGITALFDPATYRDLSITNSALESVALAD